MLTLSFRSVWYVMIRNYMSFKRLFKISIFPNLVDPILFLIAMGIGLGYYLQEIDGIPYSVFVASGLVAATGMMATTAEVTVNAFIQMRVEKTYSAVTLTPINIQDVVVGQIVWSACRSIIYGVMFLLVAALFGVVHSWMVVLVPIVLFVSGILFGAMGMTFTALAPNRDYLNYYNVLFVRPMYMFSDIFFPINQMSDLVQKIAWLSPLYHASHLCRGLLLGQVSGLWGDALWLLIVSACLVWVPVVVIKKKFAV
jgi:lipooligosaccharide transport system permease protein